MDKLLPDLLLLPLLLLFSLFVYELVVFLRYLLSIDIILDAGFEFTYNNRLHLLQVSSFLFFVLFFFSLDLSIYYVFCSLCLCVKKNEEFVFSSVSLLGSFSVVSREYYYFYYYYHHHHLHAFNIVYCFLTSSHYLNTHLLRFIINFTIANLKDKDSKIDKN